MSNLEKTENHLDYNSLDIETREKSVKVTLRIGKLLK